MNQCTFPKDKIRFLLLEGVHPACADYLKEQGYTNIIEQKDALDDEELCQAVKGVHVLGIRSRTQVSASVLEAADKLLCVGCFCIGTNQVDLTAAKKKGIPVFNAPFSNTRSVAELVVAEIIMLMRGVSEKNILAHQGRWLKSPKSAHEVRGKKLGILGHGHIGMQVAVLAENFGMDVHYYDIKKTLSFSNATPVDSLEKLLATSDIVTLHVPSTDLTKNMIGAAELAQMQPGSYLINASRGNVVDIQALEQCLSDGHIAGAAIDVFPEEPASNQDRFTCELQGFNNVILTPHIGGSTEEAQENIATEVAEKFVCYSDNGSTAGAVNFVQVTLPSHTGMSRFLHIHENVPGVLEAVNLVFSSKGMNIAAQYLQTDADIGYLIADIEGKIDKSILDELRQIPATIKARILY